MTNYVRFKNKLIFMNGKDPLSYFDLTKHEYVQYVKVNK